MSNSGDDIREKEKERIKVGSGNEREEKRANRHPEQLLKVK